MASGSLKLLHTHPLYTSLSTDPHAIQWILQGAKKFLTGNDGVAERTC